MPNPNPANGSWFWAIYRIFMLAFLACMPIMFVVSVVRHSTGFKDAAIGLLMAAALVFLGFAGVAQLIGGIGRSGKQ